jgi:tetratricopeptide (TPR) repeat protein
MLRRNSFFVGIALFVCVGCFSQESPTIGSPDPASVPSRRVGERPISVVRLREPRKARELYESARKAFRKRKFAEAEEKLNRALLLYPSFPEALTMRGYIQIDLNRWELAEQSLQDAVRSDPTSEMAYRLLAGLYNREQRFDDALLASQRAAELTPDSWADQYELARALIGKHQYALALKVSDASLGADRGTLLHMAKAHALIGLDRYPEAASELHTYLRYQPAGEGSADAHELLNQIQKLTAQ